MSSRSGQKTSFLSCDVTASRYSYIFFTGSFIDRTAVSHGQEGVSVPAVVVGLAFFLVFGFFFI